MTLFLQETNGLFGLPTAIATCSELGLSQSPTLHFAEYLVVPSGITMIDSPVEPFDQTTVPSHP